MFKVDKANPYIIISCFTLVGCSLLGLADNTGNSIFGFTGAGLILISFIWFLNIMGAFK